MSELETLQAYRAGQLNGQTVIDRFKAAGWDDSDVGLLLNNISYTRGDGVGADFAERFIRTQEAARRKQTNPLMPR